VEEVLSDSADQLELELPSGGNSELDEFDSDESDIMVKRMEIARLKGQEARDRTEAEKVSCLREATAKRRIRYWNEGIPFRLLE